MPNGPYQDSMYLPCCHLGWHCPPRNKVPVSKPILQSRKNREQQSRPRYDRYSIELITSSKSSSSRRHPAVHGRPSSGRYPALQDALALRTSLSTHSCSSPLPSLSCTPFWTQPQTSYSPVWAQSILTVSKLRRGIPKSMRLKIQSSCYGGNIKQMLTPRLRGRMDPSLR